MKITYDRNEKLRLDKFLLESIKLSRNQIQKLIKDEVVLVNDEKATPHHFLKNGDVVSVIQKDVKEAQRVKKFGPNTDIKLKIVFENDDFMVIDKPSGLMVHPTEQMEDDTLANALVAYYPKIKTVGDNPMRPGIVHRLDKNVSGLLVIAKNQKTFTRLKSQFARRKVHKEYIALVHGDVSQDSGVINMPISRSVTKKRMAAHPEGSELGKEAITEYTVTERFKNFTLLTLKIHTGRTHQIRAHLNAMNYPIVGDKLYKQKFVKQNLELDRVFLHAYKLGITDKDKVEHTFTSPLPKQLKNVLDSLR